MFLLFGIFVAVVAAVLFLVLTISVLVRILVAIPRVLRESMQVFWSFKREVIWLEEVLDVEKSFFFAVTFIILFGKSSPKRISESAGTFFLSAWYWLSGKYAIWLHLFCSRSVFTWLSTVSESVQSWTIVYEFLFRVVVFKFLLFFNSSNALVTLGSDPTAFKMQPCISCVFRSLDLVFGWSISLQISGFIFGFLRNLNVQV